MDSNHWLANPHTDPQLPLPAGYDVQALANQLSYIQDSWLWQNYPARILITGAHTYLGHYLLHLCTQYQFPAQIFATSPSPAPDYLACPRYQGVQYLTTQRRWLDLSSFLTNIRPHIIFHADQIWNIQDHHLTECYEINVVQTELLCQLACSLQVNRMILFSDSSVYGDGNVCGTINDGTNAESASIKQATTEPAAENSPLAPVHGLAKSFVEAENIAAHFHDEHNTQIYHLRLAAMYGPLVSDGMMRIAKLISDGILLGLPQHAPYQISLASGYDVALAAFLVALAPKPGHRIFNVSTPPILFADLLATIAQYLPCQNILGIPSRLASMMKIGYQKDIQIPTPALQFLGQLCQHTTNFLNQFRWNTQAPAASSYIMNHLLQMRVLKHRRLYDSLGWSPSYQPEKIQQTLDYALQYGWHFPTKNPRPESQQRDALDCAISIVQAVTDFVPDAQEEIAYWPLYGLGCASDTKSLWIILDRLWSLVGTILVKGGGGASSSHHILEIFPQFTENLLLLMRYEHDRSLRKFPSNKAEQIHWLTQQIGSVNCVRLKFYVQVAALAHALSHIQQLCAEYGSIAQLLPDKNFGLFLASESGDIGIVLEAKDSAIAVKFLRAEIDNIPRSWSFHRRILEFQKLAKLHIALGVRIERLFQDILSGQFLTRVKLGLGKDYFLSDTSQHYRLIGEAVNKTAINTYIFLDTNNQPAFGVQLKDKKILMLSHEYLEMIRLLRQFNEDDKQMIQTLHQASQGQDELAILRIQTVRRLLSSVIAPSRFRILIFKLLGRAVKLSKR